MDYLLLNKEVREFVLGCAREYDLYGGREWDTLPSIELGLLSWHIDSFYYYPLWWIEDTV